MRKTVAWIMFFAWMVSAVLFQGCAVNKPFVKKDMQALSPLKVVRQETPEVRIVSVGRTLLGAALGAVLLGGVGAGIGVAMLQEKVGPEDKAHDFGLLVEKKFIAQAVKEIPNWPTMDVQEQPVAGDYTEKCAVLEFKVNRIAIGNLGGDGLTSITIVTMKDSNGEVIWEKSFKYSSIEFARVQRSSDDLLADNKKLLGEEIEFAADKTAAFFIANLKAGI